MVPERLALALLADEPDSVAEQELLVGRVPDDFPADLVPPAPATIVGARKLRRSMQAVFAYPLDAPDPLTTYAALLTGVGFTPPRMEVNGGFENTFFSMLCRESVLAMVSKLSLNDEVLLTVALSPDSPACKETRDEHRARMLAHVRDTPFMKVPPGVTRSSGAGSCSSGDRTMYDTRLLTPMSCAELVAWYGKQLVAAGWDVGNAIDDGDVVSLRVEKAGGEGGARRGLLTAYENGRMREVILYTALVSS